MASNAVQLAASIVDLSELALKALQHISIYAYDVATAPSRFQELTREINDLMSLHFNLRRLVDNGDLVFGNRLESVIKKFEGLLRDIVMRLDPTNVKGIKRLTFLQSQNEEYITRIRKLKSEVSLVLSIAQTDLIERMDRRVRTMEETAEGDRCIERLSKILDQLCMPTIDPIKDQKKRKSLLTKGTGEWIFTNESYKFWSQTRGSTFLWMNGHVGVGKTVLTSSIIASIEKLADELDPTVFIGPLPHIGLAYFYCEGGSSTNQLSATVAGSLLRQLTVKMIAGGAASNVLERYVGNFDTALEYLLESLEWSFKFFSEVYLIIDGLDECSDRMCLLRKLYAFRASNVRVLVTSRPEIDISLAFTGKQSLVIDDHVMDDIATHVAWALESEPRLSNIHTGLKDEIQRELIERCGGMFQWISCQLDYLKTLRSDAARRKALKSLPPNLPQTYLSILNRISRHSEDIRLAMAAMKWLLFLVHQSVTVSELALAAAISIDDPFSDEHRLDNDDDILEICSSLVKVNSDKKVELAHFSVKEFFSSEKLPNGMVNPYFISKASGNEFIARASFSYLSSPMWRPQCWPTKPIFRDIESGHGRLYDYIAVHWPGHVEESKLSESSDFVIRILQLLKESAHQAWLVAWYRWERGKRAGFYLYSNNSIDSLRAQEDTLWKMPPCSPPTPLYISVTENYFQVTSKILELGGTPNARGGYLEFPLFSAIQNRSIAMLQLLLDKGSADPNIIGKGGKTPLHVAASFWLTEIVEILIKYGADISRKTPSGELPLMSALGPSPSLEGVVVSGLGVRDHDEPPLGLLKMLIPAEPFDFRGQTNPLHVAVERALTDAAKLFLHSAYLNDQDHNGNTPLHLAAQSRYGNMVELLLSNGADRSIRNVFGWTPLHYALWIGELPVVAILYQRPVPRHRLLFWGPRHWINAEYVRMECNSRRVNGSRGLELSNTIDVLLELALEYFVKDSPTDHLVASFLSLCHTRQSRFDTGIELYENSLRMNEQNRGCLTEEVVHGLPCAKCSTKVVGRLFICAICHQECCTECVESETSECQSHAFMHPIPRGELYEPHERSRRL